jgi:hypothetical protein
MQIGDTFLWNEGGHLWVVISDPSTHAGEFIAVNLTKDEFRAGKECELAPGDHQWIREKTFVSFGDAMRYAPKNALNLEKQIALGTMKRHYPMKHSVLQKIIAAAKVSKAIPVSFIELLEPYSLSRNSN